GAVAEPHEPPPAFGLAQEPRLEARRAAQANSGSQTPRGRRQAPPGPAFRITPVASQEEELDQAARRLARAQTSRDDPRVVQDQEIPGTQVLPDRVEGGIDCALRLPVEDHQARAVTARARLL